MEGFEDFYIDEEEVEKAQQEREAKQKERMQRVMGGADSRVVGVDEALEDGATTTAAAEMTLEDREKKWGFSLDELKAATKVVNVLFNNPQLYVGDPYLAESRMYTMISRDRKTKRENKETFKKIQNEEKRLRDKSKREADVATIKKTLMKKERDAALSALMIEGPEENSTLLIKDSTAAAEDGETDAAKVASPTNNDDEDVVNKENILSDYVTSFKVLKFLEREYSRLGGPVIDPNADVVNDEHLYDASEKFKDADVNWNRISTAIAKYYRVYPHEYSTSMTVPIYAEDILYRKLDDLLGGRVKKSAEEEQPVADGEKTAATQRFTASNIARLFSSSENSLNSWYNALPSSSSDDDDVDVKIPSMPWTLRDLDTIRSSKAMFDAIVTGPRSALPYDWMKMPVGKINLHLIEQAAKVLLEIRTALTSECEDASKDTQEGFLTNLSCKFFSVIPYITGHAFVKPILTVAALQHHEEFLSALSDILFLAVLPTNAAPQHKKLHTRSTVEQMKFLSAGQPEMNDMFDTTEQSSGSVGGGRNKTRKRPPGAQGGKFDTTTSLRATDAEDFVEEETNDAGEVVATISYALFDKKDVFRVDVFGLLGRGGAVVACSPTSPDDPSPTSPQEDAFVMNRLQKCHTCKIKYNELHGFYYSLCPPCGEYNYDKRMMTRDLRGKVVVLTGARIKIGYAMALSLLRCGATLIGTTRFSHDAVARFMQESDYDAWKDRLHLYSLDLRDMWMVTQFCAFIGKNFPKIFAIINNAAQTIARTADYTADLRNQEVNPAPKLVSELKTQGEGKSNEWWNFFNKNCSVTVGESLQLEHHPEEHAKPFVHGAQNLLGDTNATSAHVDPTATNTASQQQQQDGVIISTLKPASEGFIYDRYDTQAEESDRRTTNSWTMNMAEVQGSEAAEVMAINALSPFVINSKLKPQLMNREGDKSPNEKRFIINVSAMEGQFYRFKQTTHPHTNMAKAALNMMTRTSAGDYIKDGIFMNSVDTGWITDESPMQKKQRRSEEFMLCPLDEVDAAARCLDLIYSDSTEHGKFYKDFHTIAW